MGDNTSLLVAFLIALALTVLLYLFLWRHRPYGKAKRVVENAKANGWFTMGYQVRIFTLRSYPDDKGRSGENRHYIKYKYQVDGQEYYKWLSTRGTYSPSASTEIYYNANNPRQAYTITHYSYAHAPRVWWMLLFWIPLAILIMMGIALFK